MALDKIDYKEIAISNKATELIEKYGDKFAPLVADEILSVINVGDYSIRDMWIKIKVEIEKQANDK